MPRHRDFPENCTFTFDGHAVPARAGEPIAAALLAAGRPLLSRSAKYHRPRGAFCLAGSCGTCLVRADGLPNQRACRVAARAGLAVESQNALPSAQHDVLGAVDLAYPRGLDHHHLMTWSGLANRATVAFSRALAGLGTLPGAGVAGDPRAAAARPPAPAPVEVDALVVGAGPAGVAAAEALAARGRRVLLAESEPRPGGRLRARLEAPGGPDLAWVQAALARVRAAGGEVALSTTVLGLYTDPGAPGRVLALLRSDDGPPAADGAAPLRLVRPRGVVLCVGGAPQPPPLEDGDRPGVYAARGLLAALAEHGVVPGRAGLVLGGGDEAAGAAARLREAGMEVTLLEGAEDGRVSGRARVRSFTRAGAAVRCDTIAVATPPAPLTELGRMLGAEVVFEPGCAAFALKVDAAGGTGVPGLLAAGEVTGAATAIQAAEAGRRAAEALP